MTKFNWIADRSRSFVAFAVGVIGLGGALLVAVNTYGGITGSLRLVLNGFVYLTFGVAICAVRWRGQRNEQEWRCGGVESELKRVRGKLESFVTNSSSGLFTVDRNGVVVEVEGSTIAPRGGKASELIGSTLEESFPGQDVFLADTRHGLENGMPVSTTLKVRDRTYEVTCRPRRLPTGRIDGFIAIAHEVTAAREAEEELRRTKAVLTRSREELRLYRDEGAIGAALFDRNGRLVEANRALCEELQYCEEDLLGKSAEDLIHPGDIGRSMQLSVQLRSGTSDRGEIEQRYFRRDGTLFESLSRVSVWRDARGDVDRVLVQVDNVTEVKETRRKLESAQRALALILGASDDALLVLDGDSRVVAMSAGFADLIGVNSSEGVEGPGIDIMRRVSQCSPESMETLEEWFTGEANVEEILVLTQPVERRYAISSRVFPDGSGRILVLRPEQMPGSPTLVMKRVGSRVMKPS